MDFAKDYPESKSADEENHRQGRDDEQQQISFLSHDCQAGDYVKNDGGSSVDSEVYDGIGERYFNIVGHFHERHLAHNV